MPSQPSEVVRNLIEQWNKHDPVKAASLLSEDVEYLDVTQASPFRKRKDVQAFFASFFEAFPDLSFEITNMFAEGIQVVCEWRMRGTQEKEIDGLNGIGKSIDLVGVSVCRLQGDKIVRQVDYWDSGTMKSQLGVTD